MAGDWIKLECATPQKPEVFEMADILGIDADAVVGKLIIVWIWADQQTYDGNAPSVTRSLIDRLTDVAGFAEAMKSVGWLLEDQPGLTFPNFGKHNGQTAKKRALTARRAAKHRGKGRNESSADRSAKSATKRAPKKEKKREENNPPSLSPPRGSEESRGKVRRDGPKWALDFEFAWSQLLKYRESLFRFAHSDADTWLEQIGQIPRWSNAIVEQAIPDFPDEFGRAWRKFLDLNASEWKARFKAAWATVSQEVLAR